MFNAVRVPVTWNTHIGPAPNYTIDQTWPEPEEVVITFLLVIIKYINVHCDDWIILHIQMKLNVKISSQNWQQIAIALEIT